LYNFLIFQEIKTDESGSVQSSRKNAIKITSQMKVDHPPEDLFDVPPVSHRLSLYQRKVHAPTQLLTFNYNLPAERNSAISPQAMRRQI
jgi:hypothetical protein